MPLFLTHKVHSDMFLPRKSEFLSIKLSPERDASTQLNQRWRSIDYGQGYRICKKA
jgi:hypothetical protein